MLRRVECYAFQFSNLSKQDYTEKENEKYLLHSHLILILRKGFNGNLKI
jgi:hypothetical protein